MEHDDNNLIIKIRREFGFFAGISVLFGISSTALFYRASVGLNSLLFTVIIAGLFIFISNKLNLKMTPEVVFCLSGAVLLGLSNVLTSSFNLQFLNNVGILLLWDFSLIRLLCIKKSPDFADNLLELIKLPFNAISSIGMIFTDGNLFVKSKKIIKSDRLRNILIGCIIAIPLLIINLALLSKADLLFGKITGKMFSWIFSSDIFIVLILVILAAICCYSLLCGAAKETPDEQKEIKASPTIGITISAIMLATYIIFCGIQILYLFAGGIFTLPEEFTYSEYARRGFFELLAVTGFNIILTLVCSKVFEANRRLRSILTAITACTYIMIASATYRMLLYIGAYHLTFLRLFVLLFLLIDALILAGVIISLYKKSFPLFTYSVVVLTLCYGVFSLSRPDYHIAGYLVNHTEKLEEKDLYFLATELSLDAAPVVLPLLEKQYNYDIKDIKELYYYRLLYTDSRDLREYNLSYSKAAKLIKNRIDAK